MWWKLGPCFLALIAIVLSASSCSRFDSSEVRLGEEFYLSIGQRASIAGEDLEVRFKQVTEDSRCPRGVTCIWAGQVTSVVELTYAGVSNCIELTEPGLTDEYSRESHKGYELAFHMTPYPQAGEKTPTDAYRLHLIISKLPEPTRIIGSIVSEPFAFDRQYITIIGYYRGWDLLHEVNTGPPVTRSDWVIRDLTGAIYISADSEAVVPEGLHPSSLQHTDIILRVSGIVRVTKEGLPYVEATSIERLH